MAENYFGITDTGRQRTNNEDTFIAEKVLGGQFVMACVIDGVGGYEGGELAAALARQTLLGYFTVLSGDVTTMLKEAIIEANKKIYNERLRNKEKEQMACVLTVALVDVASKQFYYAHVGDTRLYLFRDASLIKVTKDHSFVGFLEDTGRLSEEGAMQHPKRNEINKALGFDAQIASTPDYIETGSSPFLPGDFLLLCSDGLTDMINKAEISSILSADRTLEEKGKELVNAANAKGGKDNITAVLVQNNSSPIKLKATKPKAVKKKDHQKVQQAINQPKAQQPRINEKAKESVLPPSTQKPKKDKTILFLSLFCLLLLGLVGWLLYQQKRDKGMVAFVPEAVKSAYQKSVQDTINNFNGDTLLLDDTLMQQPFLLSDSLIIAKDSLVLKGNKNFVFTADTSYKGPAFVIHPTSKYVVLENITFENFDIGIKLFQKKLRLKNVRFKNCTISVQQGYNFPDNVYVNGTISDTTFFKTDSLPK